MAQILVVEDELEMNAYMALALRMEGHTVLQAHTGREALETAREHRPDLILSDMQMPVMGGLEFAKILHAEEPTATIPIIFVTGRNELEDRIQGLELAVDYIVKPFATAELLARVRSAVRLRSLELELRAANDQLAQANQNLEGVNEQLKQLALTDELTQICNRRGFDKWLEDELWRAQRLGTPLALLMFDLDHFKFINDTWGHAQGDMVLQEFARLMRNSSRHIDVVARFGGEEFAVVLPSTNLRGAEIFAEKVRATFAETDIPRVTSDAENLSPLRVTTSGGGAIIQSFSGLPLANLPQDLTHAADHFLYEAKSQGRNRVIVRRYESPQIPAGGRDCFRSKSSLPTSGGS